MLDIAGQVFAERGYADATSKEICTRAGTNSASVNYHFGSRDSLYEAVLVEAHHHLMPIEDLAAIVSMPGDPRLKLRAALGRVIEAIAGPGAHWGPRVLIREMLSPTAAAPALVRKAIAPKAKLMLDVVAEIMDLPVTHPAVQRSLFFIFAPCFAMLVAPREVRQGIMPALAQHPAELVEDFLRHSLAGLEAQAAAYRGT